MSHEETFISLVRRACDRDELAATELVRRFEPELRRIIRFQLTDPGMRRFLDSLDICQSVLGAFFAQLHAGNLQLTQPRQLAGLLAMMARHKVIDRGRQYRSVRHGGKVVRGVADGLADVTVDAALGPAEVVANRELLAPSAPLRRTRPRNPGPTA